MLVCSCNVISRIEIEEVVVGFLREDQWQLVTPGKVYAAMQRRGKCCGCFPNVVNVIVDATTRFHRDLATPEAEIIPFVARIVAAHEKSSPAHQLATISRSRRVA